MISTDQIQDMIGGNGTVVSDGGDKIGDVGQVYLDDQTGQPEWVTTRTGLFGTSESFIPLAEAIVSGDEVRVPYGKGKVKGAPRVDADGSLSQDQEASLYDYYGIAYTEATSDSGLPAGGSGVNRGVVDRDTSRETTDDAMTRSEEQLRVGTQRVEAGRARLRKFVVTEKVSQTVPVAHDEVRLEREPITDANRAAAMDGPDITDAEHEVTLYAEQAVTTKETVPIERVRVGTETVTENQQVTGEVRKEQIELDTDTTFARDTTR